MLSQSTLDLDMDGQKDMYVVPLVVGIRGVQRWKKIRKQIKKIISYLIAITCIVWFKHSPYIITS